MPSQTCWLCDEELTTTKEHIIPESMGGKKTVRGFICRNCNSKSGHDWDAAVTSFESWKFKMTTDLHINPQRDKPIRAHMADTGLNVNIHPGFQVSLGFNAPREVQSEDGQVNYQLTQAPDRVDDLFIAANKLLMRRGQNPMAREEFDARVRRSEISQPLVRLSLKLDMASYYRSLVKTSMAMAFSVGINPIQCENAVRYLKDEAMDMRGVVSLPEMSLEGILDDWADYHAVTILSFPDERRLIGEVVYFGHVAGLVILSNSYGGSHITAGHAINLRTGEYVDADLDLSKTLLTEDNAIELLKTRVGQFKSPIVLQVLDILNTL